MPFDDLKHSNTSKEEWHAVKDLADDRTIIIKRLMTGRV